MSLASAYVATRLIPSAGTRFRGRVDVGVEVMVGAARAAWARLALRVVAASLGTAVATAAPIGPSVNTLVIVS